MPRIQRLTLTGLRLACGDFSHREIHDGASLGHLDRPGETLVNRRGVMTTVSDRLPLIRQNRCCP